MSTISAGTTSGTALVSSGDTTGQLVFKTNGTTTALTLGTDQSATFAGNVVVTGTMAAASPFAITANSTAGAEIRLPEDSDNGSNYIAIKAPDSLASNITFTMPSTAGTSGQAITTNGSGTLSFSDILPSQTSNSGKYLTTNGTTASWGTIALPGATELYSVVTSGYTSLVASPTSITTGTFYSSVPVISSGISTGANNTNNCPIWSKYYSCWFSIGYGDSGTSFNNIYYSKDGINWATYIYDLGSKIGSPGGLFSFGPGAGYANIIVDESNGRLWTFYRASDGLSIIGYYKNAATGMDSNWTNAGSVISLSNSATYYGARYVDTGTDATSAIVLLCSNNLNDNRLYTCDAGGTTFTIRINGGTSNSANQPTSFTIDSVTGRAAILYESQPYCAYMTTNNARTGWAYNSNYGGGSGSGTQCTIGVGGGYYVTPSGSQGSTTLYYSATGAGTWTTITNACGAGNTIQRVMYVNGVWYATTLNGMYKTSQNPPTTGWTQISPSPRILGIVNVRTQA